MNDLTLLETLPEKGYELLDSGAGEKLERYGKYIVSRPDPQALWGKRLPETEWKRADAHFAHGSERGTWSRTAGFPEKWEA